MATDPRPTVVLFDVDGTLLHTSAGRRAIDLAFGEVTGREDACVGFRFGGMTDPLIVRTGLRAIGWPDDEGTMARVLEAYLRFLEAGLAEAHDYRVMPHVEPLLDALEGVAALAVGLGTGNLEAGARLKLARGGLAARFAFGGFGSDAEDRAVLLRRGAERGAARLGCPVDAADVVVIGDTPRDVHAAHAIGARCVAVATGPFAAEELAALEPALVVEDLRDAAVLDLVLGRG